MSETPAPVTDHAQAARDNLVAAADCFWTVNGHPAEDERLMARLRVDQANAHAALALADAIRELTATLREWRV